MTNEEAIYSLAWRLLTKVVIEESGCWRWMGAKNKYGYGHIKYRRKQMRVHRVSYALFVGALADGELVLHTCDNRWCCAPNHLRKGTHSDNLKDEYRRFRKKSQQLVLIRGTHKPNGVRHPHKRGQALLLV